MPPAPQPQKAQQAQLRASSRASPLRHPARVPARAETRSWGLHLRTPALRVLRGPLPQLLRHAVPKARRAWASPSGATSPVASRALRPGPPLPAAGSGLLLRRSCAPLPATLPPRLSRLRSSAPGPLSVHVTLLQPACPNCRTPAPLGAQQSTTPQGTRGRGPVGGPAGWNPRPLGALRTLRSTGAG